MNGPWRFLCGMGLATCMALLPACAGDREKVAYDWKMPLRETAVLEKYRQVVVDVQGRDGLRLPASTLERLALHIGECFRTVPGGKLMPVLKARPGQGTLDAEIYITRYDDGIAFARSAFQEPGSMHIDGEVTLSDGQSKEKLAEFGVSQAYDRSRSFFGVVTSIEELEPQFAQGVVAGIVQQAQ